MGSDTRLMDWLASRKDEAWRNERVIPLRMAPVEVQVIGSGTLDVLRVRNVSTTGLGLYFPHGFVGFDLAKQVVDFFRGVPTLQILKQNLCPQHRH